MNIERLKMTPRMLLSYRRDDRLRPSKRKGATVSRRLAKFRHRLGMVIFPLLEKL